MFSIPTQRSSWAIFVTRVGDFISTWQTEWRLFERSPRLTSGGISSYKNPADTATRGLQAKDLAESDWLNGPEFLKCTTGDAPAPDAEQLTLSVDDPAVRKEVKSRATNIKPNERTILHEGVFKNFSSWSSLKRAIAALIVKMRLFKRRNTADKALQQETEQHLTPVVLTQAPEVIVKAVHHEGFKEELSAIASATPQSGDSRSGIKERKRNLKKSHLYRFDPYIDDAGILRVGGRLRRSNLSSKEKHLVILPKNHHLSKLLLRYEEVHHQGR